MLKSERKELGLRRLLRLEKFEGLEDAAERKLGGF